MITRVLNAADERAIEQAARLILDDQLVGFPTETVYGLGANALSRQAVARIFEAKGRPGDNPLIVHVHALEQAKPLIEGELPAAARALAGAFWPGPLTMVFPKSKLVPRSVSAGLDTVGIRMPSHPVALALIRMAGVPIAAPSANLSGRPSPTSAEHVLLDMDGRIPLILDGGVCGVGLESTVLDMTQIPPRVLRPGGVTPEMIGDALGIRVDVDERVMRALHAGEAAPSPGMKHRHYAPIGELSIYTGSPGEMRGRINEAYDRAVAQGKRCCILVMQPRIPLYGGRETHSLGKDEPAAAQALFAALREMDARGVEVILAEGFKQEGIGLALMNRMARAAGFRIVSTEEQA